MRHNFIISLPRSGSTVLTRMLSVRDDVICLPESFFPHLLDFITPEEWKDTRFVAALFITSCSDGSPLTLEECLPCIAATHEETLHNIASRVALKEGRAPDSIKAVVWKATRLIGSNRAIQKFGWRNIILHRPYLNVYESQFRVSFGNRNRKPSRFALFASSYDAAFRRYDERQTLNVKYSTIPEQLSEIFEWIGSESARESSSTGSVEVTSGQRAWHTEINKPFRNDDTNKLTNLMPSQIRVFETFKGLLDTFTFVGSVSRGIVDALEAKSLKSRAYSLISSYSTNKKTT